MEQPSLIFAFNFWSVTYNVYVCLFMPLHEVLWGHLSVMNIMWSNYKAVFHRILDIHINSYSSQLVHTPVDITVQQSCEVEYAFGLIGLIAWWSLFRLVWLYNTPTTKDANNDVYNIMLYTKYTHYSSQLM